MQNISLAAVWMFHCINEVVTEFGAGAYLNLCPPADGMYLLFCRVPGLFRCFLKMRNVNLIYQEISIHPSSVSFKGSTGELDLHVLGMWEEAGVPEGNPRRQGRTCTLHNTWDFMCINKERWSIILQFTSTKLAPCAWACITHNLDIVWG